MKIFVSCNCYEVVNVFFKTCGRQGDCRAEGMLHPAIERVRGVIDEQIFLKRTVIHPMRRAIYDAMDNRDNSFERRSCIFSVEDYPVFTAAAAEIRFGKCTDFYW